MKTIFKSLHLLLLLFFGCQPQHISNPASTHSDTLQVDSLGEEAPYTLYDGHYYYQKVSFSGLQIGGTYAKEEVINLVGVADRIKESNESDSVTFGYSKQLIYVYPNSNFIFHDNRLNSFQIKDPNLLIDNIIRIGQDTSVLRIRYHHIDKRSNDVFYLWYDNDPIVIESVNGKISSIQFDRSM